MDRNDPHARKMSPTGLREFSYRTWFFNGSHGNKSRVSPWRVATGVSVNKSVTKGPYS
ncbi:hypothetical protein [Pontibacter diazotrophicus]|uniref:hypothetical protein n=1 Tax=Pontibacter diazotrophicus TaxID=1400979 RepID=UPI0015F137A0|nr:hypothetical protein [Pontibacter diazotrophicus]